MFSIKNIKQGLKLIGINNLAVKFDTENQLVLASYTLAGRPHTEQISFADIENALQDSDCALEVSPGSKNSSAEQPNI